MLILKKKKSADDNKNIDNLPSMQRAKAIICQRAYLTLVEE